MQITVIGTGYVGIVTAVVFASLGHKVKGLDINAKKINQLNKGKSPIYEPELESLLNKCLKQRKLSFTTSYKNTLLKSKVIFICVGTPSKKDGSYDSKYVFSAVRSVAKNLKNYAVLVIKSTVPPSATEEIRKIMQKNCQTQYDLASMPEFLREGSAVSDALNPDRIVIGVESPKAKKILLSLHEKLPGKKILMDIKSAQLVKYAANSFLATKISFINSLAILCDKMGANIDQVADGFGSDSRIGTSFLQAGLGYGGSCFPKDINALIAYSKDLAYDFSFLKQVNKINDQQVDYFITKIKKLLRSKLKGKTISILGLSFKPNTDDMREARSVILIDKLVKIGANIRTYDPIAMSKAKKIIGPKIFFADNAYECVEGSHLLCLVTEWQEFAGLSFSKIKNLMLEPNIIDGRNFLDQKSLKKIGFRYEGIGR